MSSNQRKPTVGERLLASLPPLAWGEQKVLADKAGVTPESLNRILSGTTKEPGFEIVGKIARAAGISLDALFDGGSLPVVRFPTADTTSKADRRRVVEVAEWLLERFDGADLERRSRRKERATSSAQSHSADNVALFTPVKRTSARWSEEFPVQPRDFVERDYDYPLEVHALRSEATDFAAGRVGIAEEVRSDAYTLHDPHVRDDTHRVIRVRGDSMAPVLCDGWKVLVDLQKRTPGEGDPVAVYGPALGSMIGYWDTSEGTPHLTKANPAFAPVALDEDGGWQVLGVIQKVVDHPLLPRKR